MRHIDDLKAKLAQLESDYSLLKEENQTYREKCQRLEAQAKVYTVMKTHEC